MKQLLRLVLLVFTSLTLCGLTDVTATWGRYTRTHRGKEGSMWTKWLQGNPWENMFNRKFAKYIANFNSLSFCVIGKDTCSLVLHETSEQIASRVCPEGSCGDGGNAQLIHNGTSYDAWFCSKPQNKIDWYEYEVKNDKRNYAKLITLCRPYCIGYWMEHKGIYDAYSWQKNYCKISGNEGKAVKGTKEKRSCKKGTKCDTNTDYTVSHQGASITLNLCKKDVKKEWKEPDPFWMDKNLLCDSDADCDTNATGKTGEVKKNRDSCVQVMSKYKNTTEDAGEDLFVCKAATLKKMATEWMKRTKKGKFWIGLMSKIKKRKHQKTSMQKKEGKFWQYSKFSQEDSRKNQTKVHTITDKNTVEKGSSGTLKLTTSNNLQYSPRISKLNESSLTSIESGEEQDSEKEGKEKRQDGSDVVGDQGVIVTKSRRKITKVTIGGLEKRLDLPQGSSINETEEVEKLDKVSSSKQKIDKDSFVNVNLNKAKEKFKTAPSKLDPDITLDRNNTGRNGTSDPNQVVNDKHTTDKKVSPKKRSKWGEKLKGLREHFKGKRDKLFGMIGRKHKSSNDSSTKIDASFGRNLGEKFKKITRSWGRKSKSNNSSSDRENREHKPVKSKDSKNDGGKKNKPTQNDRREKSVSELQKQSLKALPRSSLKQMKKHIGGWHHQSRHVSQKNSDLTRKIIRCKQKARGIIDKIKVKMTKMEADLSDVSPNLSKRFKEITGTISKIPEIFGLNNKNIINPAKTKQQKLKVTAAHAARYAHTNIKNGGTTSLPGGTTNSQRGHRFRSHGQTTHKRGNSTTIRRHSRSRGRGHTTNQRRNSPAVRRQRTKWHGHSTTEKGDIQRGHRFGSLSHTTHQRGNSTRGRSHTTSHRRRTTMLRHHSSNKGRTNKQHGHTTRRRGHTISNQANSAVRNYTKHHTNKQSLRKHGHTRSSPGRATRQGVTLNRNGHKRSSRYHKSRRIGGNLQHRRTHANYNTKTYQSARKNASDRKEDEDGQTKPVTEEKRRVDKEHTKTGGCPANMPMVSCFMDPCTMAKCDGHPNAKCRANYCGGCNAEWYEGTTRITCKNGNRY